METQFILIGSFELLHRINELNYNSVVTFDLGNGAITNDSVLLDGLRRILGIEVAMRLFHKEAEMVCSSSVDDSEFYLVDRHWGATTKHTANLAPMTDEEKLKQAQSNLDYLTSLIDGQVYIKES